VNIPDLIQKATDFILTFNLEKFLKGFKPIVIVFALIAMVLILIGAFFSLIPQF